MSHPIKSEPSLSASVSSTASSNQSGSNDFVKKLFLMLQEDSYKDVVRWTANGDSFVVLNTNEFTKEILPRHFKHSNFASFVRQLNKYDFHKVKVSNEEKMVYPYGEDAWEFKHPDFKINDRGSLENIKRKGPSSKKISSANTITNGGDFTSSSSVACNHNLSQITTAQSHLKDQVEQLRAENKQLHQDVNVLQTKYKTLIENIVAINTFDERYHRSMGILINCLLQAGIKLPPLDFPNPALMSLQQPTTGLVAQTTTTNIPNPKFHVLLVEDDNVCIQLCRKFLVKYGCQVTVVTDGLNAISTVEHTKYDLVLMDIVMPNLDGATATSVIRSFDTKTPIIAMTGNIEDNDLVTYLQNGMSDILAKPFTKDDLYSILSKHLLTDESKTAAAVGVTSRNISISGPTLPAESDEDPLLKKQRLQ
ncbi:Protein with similarity to DNA-binding region of heat shock transcription factors [Scheffersomyces stipitis CBS 6054]|uniref:Transcription factor n=1 Tax=Scheffersomyces stipitis (strain ATCC 58785 / CBS 6054 / NBRC 10063 / NRRL Y-11545) TaxID=322104 RepID=A3LZG6_PICST|nr:Protein with similarity to DNA-binding region of heat shock transcription factors [Scheffersomyces stipitis CBS 6054]ABN68155.2 Protein with similarity to DNA-binding region of heat shock transcription factors [Scheffersomyces stipitis CBS 6054]